MKIRQSAVRDGHPHKTRNILLASLFALLLPLSASAQIDINRADAKTLAESMSGVGLVKAEAIVAYRAAHGPFHAVDELAEVDGIGARTIATNRASIVIIAPDANDAARSGGHGRPFAER